jgi:hypothetical protein
MAGEPLVCPTCAGAYPPSERFCPRCAMPLVAGSEFELEQPPSALQRRARKIKPQFTEGRLVKVVGALHQTEAEFIQGLLLEEGVPSMLRRSGGFDVPDFLAAGPRDVMVPESGVMAAREVLLQSELITAERDAVPWSSTARRVMAGLLLGLALLAILAWLLHP